MTDRKLTRRQALAPLAGMALATVAFAPASAQPVQPGTPRGLTAAQQNRLNAALRNLRAAKAQVTAANLSANNSSRLTASIDSAIGEVDAVRRGRVRP